MFATSLLVGLGGALGSMGRYWTAILAARLWGELTHFDNWRTIQNNFGVLVGLPKADVAATGAPIDYLQAVKSLVYGFTCGPSLENIGRIADAFSCLPFVEHAVRVVELIEPTDVPGKVVCLNPYGRLVTYDWPVGATLTTNPTTGRPVTAFPMLDTYEDVATLPAYLDSQLPAYTRLFRATRVMDYVSDPEQTDAVLSSQYGAEGLIRRYRTVIVEAPLGGLNTTAALTLLLSHLRETGRPKRPSWCWA